MEDPNHASSASVSATSVPSPEQHGEISVEDTSTWVPEKAVVSTADADDSTAEAAMDTRVYLSGPKLYLIIISATLAVFLVLMDTSIVAVATPKITGDFQSLNDIGWYGAAYVLGNCVFQPLVGQVFTHFNAKWTFLAFFGVFEIGSALCGAATCSTMLIVGRAVAGVGGAGILGGGFIILTLIVEPAKQAGYRGIVLGLSFFGLLAGPLIGGALTEFTTWRWCFYINLPCGAVVALFLIVVKMPNNRVVGDGTQTVLQRFRQIDFIGFLLFVPTVVMLILALQWGGTAYPWGSATIIGLFIGSFGNLVVFLVWEHRMGTGAMIPLSLIRRRVVWSACLTIGFFFGCAMLVNFFFAIYFQAVRDASPVQSAVDMLPLIVSNMVVTMLTGPLIGRLGYYLPFSIGSAVFMSTATGLFSTLTPTSSDSSRIGFQILSGLQGMGFQVPVLAVQHGVRKEEVAIATSMIVFSQNLGAAIFLSLGQVIFSQELRHALSIHAPSANAEILIFAGASAAGLRKAVPPELLAAVRLAFSETFDHVMYLAAGAASATFLFAWGMGWVRINAEKNS